MRVDEGHDRGVRITLIDDIRAASDYLSPFGQRLLGPDLAHLSKHLRFLAKRHGWDVIDHGDFSAWVWSVVSSQDVIVTLDKLASPLVQVSTDEPRLYYRWTAHRQLAEGGQLALHLASLSSEVAESALEGSVTIIDDAAYTGRTLSAALDQLKTAGIDVPNVLVATCTRRAAERLWSRHGVRLLSFHQDFARGDIIHARDTYPWLPFSGREWVGEKEEKPPHNLPYSRIAPLFHDQGRWLSDPNLAQDPLLWDLAASCLESLRRILGRAPIASDLSLLGPHVAVPFDSEGRFGHDPLRDLFAFFAEPHNGRRHTKPTNR